MIFHDQQTLSLDLMLLFLCVIMFDKKRFQKHLFADALQNRFLTFFAKFTGRHLCWRLFLKNLLPSSNFFKKRLQHRCFPVNFMKLLRAPFLQNTSERLLLNVVEFFILESLFVFLDKSVFANTIPGILWFEGAKILFCYYLCRIFGLLNFLKQRGFSCLPVANFRKAITSMIEFVCDKVCYMAK